MTRDAGRYVMLVTLEIVIGIHVARNADHLEERFYIGMLFAIGNGALFLAMPLSVSVRSGALGWVLAALVSLAEFGGFIASRTVELPLDCKEQWVGHPEDYLGMVSLVMEVIVIVTAIAALRAYAANLTVSAAKLNAAH